MYIIFPAYFTYAFLYSNLSTPRRTFPLADVLGEERRPNEAPEVRSAWVPAEDAVDRTQIGSRDPAIKCHVLYGVNNVHTYLCTYLCLPCNPARGSARVPTLRRGSKSSQRACSPRSSISISRLPLPVPSLITIKHLPSSASRLNVASAAAPRRALPSAESRLRAGPSGDMRQ